MHLMQREGLLCPSFFFSFLFNAKLPSPFPPLGSTVLPLTLILSFPRLGKCPRCTRQLWLLNLSMSYVCTLREHPANISRGLPPRKCPYPFYQLSWILVPLQELFDSEILNQIWFYVI